MNFTSQNYNPPNYNPPKNTHYGQIHCSIKPENIGRLIGYRGRIFNAITRCTDIKYLWIDKNRNVIEIWGSELGIEDAKQKLIDQMDIIEPR